MSGKIQTKLEGKDLSFFFSMIRDDVCFFARRQIEKIEDHRLAALSRLPFSSWWGPQANKPPATSALETTDPPEQGAAVPSRVPAGALFSSED